MVFLVCSIIESFIVPHFLSGAWFQWPTMTITFCMVGFFGELILTGNVRLMNATFRV